MLSQIRSVILNREISIVFQPIFDIRRKAVFGYEALTRGPEGTELHRPDRLFQLAHQYGLLSKLEMMCREQAIKAFSKLKLDGKLFLNISPMVLAEVNHPHGETLKLIEEYGLTTEQIVIEISEKYPTANGSLLRAALVKYRDDGFSVAIDDLGAGYSGLKQWSEIRPDIVKIDRYFIDNCHVDNFKRKFLKAIFELAESANALVIAEGIEKEEEIELLEQLGLELAQGYLLSKPDPKPIRQYPFGEEYMPMVAEAEFSHRYVS